MKIAIFGTKRYDKEFLSAANHDRHELTFYEPNLTGKTTLLAKGFDAVCAFVNDDLGRQTIEGLHAHGVRCIALRCAGFNNVDLAACAEKGIKVVRVPKYSPYAVAEHAAALVLALNRKTHRAYNRVRESNFSIEGLLGFDLHGKTAALLGTGVIGAVAARIFRGFGMRVVAFDPYPNKECEELGVEFRPLESIVPEADILSLHCPLTPENFHIVDNAMIAQMKRGVMLINTSRGGLIDTKAVIEGLKSGHLGSVGLDVYEEEEDLFFEDLSGTIITDDTFSRLLTFPNVIVTAHQAFFTREALERISSVTIGNLTAFEEEQPLENEVQA